MEYPPCRGVGCDALLRPRNALKTDHPGTRLESARGLCFSCARAKRNGRNQEARTVTPINRELNPWEKRVRLMVETRFKGGDQAEVISMLGLTGHEEIPLLTGLETMTQHFISRAADL